MPQPARVEFQKALQYTFLTVCYTAVYVEYCPPYQRFDGKLALDLYTEDRHLDPRQGLVLGTI